MSDRSLLEDAAKAAGIYTIGDWEAFGVFAGLRAREDDAPGGYCWNPLQDDAQALRLAINLSIDIGRGLGPSRWACHYCDTKVFREDIGNDPMAATRRAIVRAAAEIGRAAAAISSQNRGVE